MTLVKVLAILSRLCLIIALSLIPALTLSAAPPDGAQPSPESSEDAPRLPVQEPEPVEDPEALELRRAASAFELAREQGAQALIALGETLQGKARDILLPEIADALELLAGLNQSLAPDTATGAGQTDVNAPTYYVGINGATCSYTTLALAIAAASSGDTLRLRTRTFNETVDITKDLTIIGGYNPDCTTLGAGTVTTITAPAAGESVFDIDDAVVVIRNLNITGGNALGGALDVLGGSRVTLDNTNVFSNTSPTYGGGVFVGTNSILTTTNETDIYGNTAAIDGGGVRVWGRFVGNATDCDIFDNTAANGGGIAVKGGVVLLNGSDLLSNHATGKGGGVYLTEGSVITLTGNVYIYDGHTAYDGAGIYADDSDVHLGGAVIHGGTATNNGGGVYLTNGSTLDAAGATIGYATSTGMNQAVQGGGIYALSSTVQFRGSLVNNQVTNSGGAVYAKASTLNLTNSTVGGTNSYEPNRVGASGYDGAGLYLTHNTHATLQNTAIISNSNANPATSFGAGLYVSGGCVVTITNSRIERNLASSVVDGRGGGLYINESTVTLDNTDVLSNTAGLMGGAIRLYEEGTLNVINGSEFRANRALNGEGGAIASNIGSSVNLTNAFFIHNTAKTDGGAVYMVRSTLVSINSSFAGGEAANHGGAIASNSATVTIRSDFNTCNPLVRQCSTLYGNTADSDSSDNGDGGAIYAVTSTLTIYHTYLHHNEAYRGGAIYQDATAGKLRVQNSLIFRNTSNVSFGAGIRAVGGMVTLQHVTIADNSGGAAYSQLGASSYITNSIAWGNDQGFLGSFVASSCNIDQGGNAGANVNPRFIGSSISNYHLAFISPAIDACATGLSPDLDNVARPGNSIYDMGAYEFVRRVYLPVTLKN